MDEVVESVAIRTEFIKLDQFLKLTGAVMSGGEAKEQIAGGCVTVNGKACLLRGKKLRSGDMVSFMGICYQITGEDPF